MKYKEKLYGKQGCDYSAKLGQLYVVSLTINEFAKMGLLRVARKFKVLVEKLASLRKIFAVSAQKLTEICQNFNAI